MRVVAAVPFETVQRRFARAHPLGLAHEANTNDEAEEHIRQAQSTLGAWQRVLLDRDDLLGMVLPWHLGEGGERELVPASGLTVAEAVLRLRELGDTYARTNPVCARKLGRMATAPFTPLFLSTHAVPGVDYEGLVVREGLIHLDGLHRALAWERAGRLTPGTRIEAFLASHAPAGAASEPRPGAAPGSGSGPGPGPDSAASHVRHRAGQDGDGLDVHAPR
ncbi:DUF6309 family protein [Streptomyces sp. NPDC050509]|uniref:DUF6309 family protein n=1 Tax=Streptomyces sp. NPDC050509 TaxID=3365620 RepID=UPI0037B88423